MLFCIICLAYIDTVTTVHSNFVEMRSIVTKNNNYHETYVFHLLELFICTRALHEHRNYVHVCDQFIIIIIIYYCIKVHLNIAYQDYFIRYQTQ